MNLPPEVLELIVDFIVPRRNLLTLRVGVYIESLGFALSCADALRLVAAHWRRKGISKGMSIILDSQEPPHYIAASACAAAAAGAPPVGQLFLEPRFDLGKLLTLAFNMRHGE